VRLVAALALVVLSCGGKREPTTSCADAAQRGVDGLVKRAHDQHNDKLDAVAPRLRALIANRCADDKWPAAAIACYTTIASMEQMRACRAKLSPTQQATLDRDEMDLFAGMSGPPGFGSAAPATSALVQALEDEVRRLNETLAADQKQLAAAATDEQRADARAAILATQQKMLEVNEMLAAARTASTPEEAVANLRAHADARAAELAKLRDEIEALDVEVKRAILASVNAKTDVERAAAKQRLEAAKVEQAEFQARLEALAAPRVDSPPR
jgi:hypothetical protein